MELRVNEIRKAYGVTTVLESISFFLGKGQRAGLVGDNGTGKTTLLKILAGLVEPDAGEVKIREGAVVGYMPQDTSFVSNETIRDYVRRVSGMAALEERMETSLEAMIEYEYRDGYTFHHRLEMMLAGFGLADISSDRLIDSLSSGQKSKVFMAGVLLSDPDILLLDEPTNNLDLPALIWLESFLVRSSAACIVVSHDRLFLDRVTQRIFEIDWRNRTLNTTRGSYSDYMERKEKERAQRLAEHEAQQKEIQRLTEQVREKKNKANRGSRFEGSDSDKSSRGFKRDRAAKSGKTARVIEKRIERMEIVEKPFERDPFRIHLRSAKPKGLRDIALANVVAGYANSNFRIGPISITVPYGGRVVIQGLNGSGKSTLLRTISGKLKPLAGKVFVGSGLIIGDLMQEHDNLPREESVKDFLTRRAGVTVQEAYALAARSGFKAVEIDKEIAALSPGGRARLLFALFSALSANALILDEPTSHLDLEALEALEEAVAHYEGTIVLVTHDRRFLEQFQVADTYTLSEGRLVRQQDFAAYIAKAEREAERLIQLL